MVLRTRAEVRAWSRAEHQAGRRVAFVPTMGALHDGHVALMHAAAKHAERVLVSVFVNPTQFGPGEDFERYPRDEAGDLLRIAAAGVHAAFLPSVDEMYPPGAATKVEVPTLAATLCGRSRPTHFGGVCLVVAKLFNMTGCDVAVFGEKDFQQLAIIRRMTRDLDLPVEVVGHPIVREADGLAMSSRNAYLDDDQRREARALSQALRIAEAAFAGGERDAKALWALAFGRVRTAKGGELDYCELVDAETLQPIEGPITRPALLALAVRFGATRLIDNTVLNP
ncbi:MAG: pantoate--beta-alanine ligase [Myxococcales bacterium]|nr:pantoate--beta-alanine ligase [Myxococcales bacterium]